MVPLSLRAEPDARRRRKGRPATDPDCGGTMKPEDTTSPHTRQNWSGTEQSETGRRRALVRDMVAGAILPGLLARKDAGDFDRGPNVVRLRDITRDD